MPAAMPLRYANKWDGAGKSKVGGQAAPYSFLIPAWSMICLNVAISLVTRAQAA